MSKKVKYVLQEDGVDSLINIFTLRDDNCMVCQRSNVKCWGFDNENIPKGIDEQDLPQGLILCGQCIRAFYDLTKERRALDEIKK